MDKIAINGISIEVANKAVDTLVKLLSDDAVEVAHLCTLKDKIQGLFANLNINTNPAKIVKQSECLDPILRDLLEKRYTRESLEKVGKGGFGSVWKGCCLLDKKFYAIKCLSNFNQSDQDSWYKLTLEVRLLSTLTHPNIVRYYSASSENDSSWLQWLCIRMQLCSRTLSSWLVDKESELLEYISIEIAYRCFSQSIHRMCIIMDILHGLHYLHERGLVHRDLHIGNIFLANDSTALIGDFGLSGVNIEPNNSNNSREPASASGV